MAKHSMDDLPIELLHHIMDFFHDPADLARFSQCSRKFNHAAKTAHVCTYFLNRSIYDGISIPNVEQRFTHEDHHHAWQKLNDRELADMKTGRTVRLMVTSPRQRLDMVKSISSETMETFMAAMLASSRMRGVRHLGQEYYSKLVMEHLSRRLGMRVLKMLVNEPRKFPNHSRGPATAIWALNCFIGVRAAEIDLESHFENTLTVMQMDGFITDNWSELPLTAATGVSSKISQLFHAFENMGPHPVPSANYYDTRNTFISYAVLDGSSAIPLTLVVIFVYFCGLLDLKAYVIPFPGEVLAMLVEGDQRVYVSPYHQRVIPRDELERTIASYGLTDPEAYLTPCDCAALCERAAQNLLACLERGSEHYRSQALYCAVVTLRLLGRQLPIPEEHFIGFVIREFPFDVFLWKDLNEPAHRAIIAKFEEESKQPPVPKLRSDQPVPIRYRVGTIFRHASFNYNAIITGWDYKCLQSEEWIAQMRVRSLERKDAQPFYNVLVADGSERYVAEDNILPLSNIEIPAIASLLSVGQIGKYFEEYDGQTFKLSVDLQELYPEDVEEDMPLADPMLF